MNQNMIYLTKSEKENLKTILIKSNSKEVKQILDKIKNGKKLKYAENKKQIYNLLEEAFKEKIIFYRYSFVGIQL